MHRVCGSGAPKPNFRPRFFRPLLTTCKGEECKPMLTCLDRTIAELEDIVTKFQSMRQSDQLQEYPAVLNARFSRCRGLLFTTASSCRIALRRAALRVIASSSTASTFSLGEREVMRRRTLDRIDVFRPTRREVPPKSSSGPLRCWRDISVAHVPEAGF